MEENKDTLEQLRSEYNVLKERLASQEIASDRLLRETMKSKVRGIHSLINVSEACGILVILASPFVFHYNPVVRASWWFIAGTILLMGFCVTMDWICSHKVSESDTASSDLLTFSKSVREVKNHFKSWTKWGLILATLWAGWFITEVFIHSEKPEMALPMVIGLAVGMVAGAFVGLRLNARIVRNCDEIISEIEEN